MNLKEMWDYVKPIVKSPKTYLALSPVIVGACNNEPKVPTVEELDRKTPIMFRPPFLQANPDRAPNLADANDDGTVDVIYAWYGTTKSALFYRESAKEDIKKDCRLTGVSRVMPDSIADKLTDFKNLGYEIIQDFSRLEVEQYKNKK